jgi:hypothetical protein
MIPREGEPSERLARLASMERVADEERRALQRGGLRGTQGEEAVVGLEEGLGEGLAISLSTSESRRINRFL